MDKIYQLHREIKLRDLKWGYSKYYDYPDGQDLLGKLSYTTKMTILPSAVLGHIYINNYKPVATTNKEKLFRLLKFMIPGAGMAVAFTCVTYFATNIRKKDDPLNYFFGGVAAGSVVGFASGNVGFGVVGVIICSFFATAKKIAQLNGKVLFPKFKHTEISSYYARNLDFTLVKDTRRGNWTRDPLPKQE